MNGAHSPVQGRITLMHESDFAREPSGQETNETNGGGKAGFPRWRRRRVEVSSWLRLAHIMWGPLGKQEKGFGAKVPGSAAGLL